MNCKHCYVPRQYKGVDVAFDAANELLNEFSNNGILKIVYTHGEVFLHPRWRDILSTASAWGFAQSILTNGLLVSEDVAQCIESLPQTRVVVSIDSASDAKHVANRRNPYAWEGLVNGLEILRRHGIRVGASTVLTDQTSGELEEIAGFCREFGIADLYFLPHHSYSFKKLTDQEIETLAARLFAVSTKFRGRCSFHIHDPLMRRSLQVREGTVARDSCGAGLDYVAIFPNGDAFPCNFLHFRLGNVFSTSLSSVLQKATDLMREAEVQILSECGGCLHVDNCGGGCKAFGFSDNSFHRDGRCQL